MKQEFFWWKKNYKYFISYLYNDHKPKPLYKMLLETTAYIGSCDGQTKWMYFLIEDNDLLKKYNTIWDKVSVNITRQFGSESVYNKEFLKNKIKSHGDEATDFYEK